MQKALGLLVPTINFSYYTPQFGFEEKHSVDSTFFIAAETIICSLDRRRYGCGIYVELQESI